MYAGTAFQICKSIRQKFLSWFLLFEQLRFISIRFCSQRRVTLYEKFRCALVLLVLICISSLKVYSCLSSKFQLLTKLDFISLPVSEHKHWNNRHSMYRRKLSETPKKNVFEQCEAWMNFCLWNRTFKLTQKWFWWIIFALQAIVCFQLFYFDGSAEVCWAEFSS